MKKKIAVIDTSVMKYYSLIAILEENFEQIILTIPTIREMDRLKASKSSTAYNVRKILAKCAEDKESAKYIVKEIEQVDTYVDINIIEFLKKNNEKYCLLTSDNAMACICKAYGIEYFFPWEFQNTPEEISENENETLQENSTEELQQENISVRKKSTLRNSYINDRNLYIDVPSYSRNIRYVIFNEAGEEKRGYGEEVQLELNDIIYIITYKKEKDVFNIVQFEVVETESCTENVAFLGTYHAKDAEEIERLEQLNKRVKYEAKKFIEARKSMPY